VLELLGSLPKTSTLGQHGEHVPAVQEHQERAFNAGDLLVGDRERRGGEGDGGRDHHHRGR
jgi:hypothetical protein